MTMSLRSFLLALSIGFAAAAQQGSAAAQASAPSPPSPQQAAQLQLQQQQTNAAAAAAAGAGAVIVSEQLAAQDPFALPAPSPRARQWLGYASPSTVLILGGALIVLAAFVGRFAPKKRRRIRRATILVTLYVTTFALAAVLHWVNADGWSRRVWFLADLFEVLVVIDLVAILLFDLVLLALRIEIANIVHDLALGAAYILAFIGMLHRSGVQLSGIIATSAVVTVVLGLSLQATLGNVLGGIALQLDDSIHVGDWLQLPTGQQGKVKAIRWRHTVVETRNWDTVIVPNSALLNDNILILGEPEDRERKQAREMAHRVAALEQIEMLSSLSSEERVQLASFMRLAPFGRSEVITRQNATAHWLYVLTKGEVEVKVRGDNGAEKLVTRMVAPNVFGEMGVVTGEPRTASVIAASEVECYRLDKEAFQRVLKQRPQIAESVSNVMARRRVELAAVREGLDADQKKARVREEKTRILESLQTFFGLQDEKLN